MTGDVEVKNAHNGKPWPTKPWPKERMEALALLWAEGLSARECGQRLGVTKNAVIGITHRHREMFIRRREPKKENRVFRKRPAKSKLVAKRKCSLAALPAAPGGLPAFAMTEAGIVRLPPEVKREPGLDLLETRDDRCKFPLPGRLQPPYRYCGEAATSPPYCPVHRALCYQPWRRYG